MLHRFLTGEPLGPDSFGSTAAPEVVIRQVSNFGMEVWDLKQGKVMRCVNSPDFLLSFDPKKSLYLYEPEGSDKGPFFGGLAIPTMCSVSPDDSRYKEFQKNRAVKVYMPTWTLNELQAAGKFLKDRSPEQICLSPKEISERFHAVGGIFRHVFAAEFNTVLAAQEEAIHNLDPKKFLLNKIDQKLPQVSHYVA